MKRMWQCLVLLMVGVGFSTPVLAQLVISPRSPLSVPITESAQWSGQLNRAKNLARQAAERVNGGLNNYRAEDAMHGPAAEAPFVENGDGTITFSFVGSRPGTNRPTVQTIATVELSTGFVQLDYNGEIQR
jgi:hypothetical protein